jgi:tetratricopeptide (TPR) repeat protein
VTAAYHWLNQHKQEVVMKVISTQENHSGNLSHRKSLLIIQAQFQQAMGQHAEAARLFLEAAVLEERLADGFRQAGNAEDAAISLFSAASCYKNAGRLAEAVACADAALSLTSVGGFAEEIRQFRDECQKPPDPAGQRTLRGVVRNGAVYPFEPDVLTEGELAPLTTA